MYIFIYNEGKFANPVYVTDVYAIADFSLMAIILAGCDVKMFQMLLLNFILVITVVSNCIITARAHFLPKKLRFFKKLFERCTIEDTVYPLMFMFASYSSTKAGKNFQPLT